jgi:ATPase subunit of ABC transporter with duplicated ATPase domains
VTVRRGGALVLSDVSLTAGPRARIGLVGPNGVGKSTLLRVLAGLEPPDAGQVLRSPTTLVAGYLPQVPDPLPGESLFAFLARRTLVQPAETAMEEARRAIDAEPGSVDRYTEALDRFLALGGDDFAGRAESVCRTVGVEPAHLRRPMGSLSGGQAARAALGAILLARFDVLLLDEPTNDLDADGLVLLETFLAGVRGGVVLVSHDRAFLERSVARIAEIRAETHDLREFAGGWTEYVRARALAEEQQRRAYDRSVAERAALVTRARALRADAAAGAARAKRSAPDPDRSLRHKRIEGAQNLGSRARAVEHRLARLEEVAKPWEPWELRLDLRPRRRGSEVVARLEAAVVERGAFWLGPVDLEVGWGERVAIAGPNGSGKSTLVGALLGTVPLTSGRRVLGRGVLVGEMDQSRELLAAAGTVLEGFAAATGLGHQEARSVLATFGLTAGHVLRAPSTLSPGERTRAQLAAIMAGGVNCLVLDEPTNHLDLPAIEELERALRAYAGTMILVTHDRALLGAVAPGRTVQLRDGRVTERA